MDTLIATIVPRSAFGGPIRGDTLFGQLCWSARHLWGGDRLRKLLRSYTEGHPFMVVSDAFPAGYLPRPALPMHRFEDVSDVDRKQARKRRWLPREHFDHPIVQWLKYAVDERTIAEQGLANSHPQPHNTINRMTGTTGAGEFAPYAMPQHWFAPGIAFDLYIAYDAERVTADEVVQLLEYVGLAGYGRDASIGLGKFDMQATDSGEWPKQENDNASMTLAPCAPQGLGFNPDHCWYQPFTRFGRHGDMAVHAGRPFKNPVLLADTGAILAPQASKHPNIAGQGLGGNGQLSKVIEETVHQGYAPVLPVRLEQAS